MSMDPERLVLIREMVSEGVLDDHVETLAEVLADRDDLAREVERLRKLHTAGVADAVRMAAELAEECDAADKAKAEGERAWAHAKAVARAADGHKAEAERLGERVGDARHGMLTARAERDEAQHEALRWAAKDHIGQRFPGEAVVKREAACLAACRGWDHLKFEADAPEGEQP